MANFREWGTTSVTNDKLKMWLRGQVISSTTSFRIFDPTLSALGDLLFFKLTTILYISLGSAGIQYMLLALDEVQTVSFGKFWQRTVAVSFKDGSFFQNPVLKYFVLTFKMPLTVLKGNL